MAQLGYGGVANTFGTRDFSGKAEVEVLPAFTSRMAIRIGVTLSGWVMFLLLGG